MTIELPTEPQNVLETHEVLTPAQIVEVEFDAHLDGVTPGWIEAAAATYLASREDV